MGARHDYGPTRSASPGNELMMNVCKTLSLDAQKAQTGVLPAP
ncbi:hypothetical protein TGAM01_v200976 [Trichoderma gamsii]|uniref:Uncharacterized protein n=1 Tax=Trichoderma gamsii TaxID=398673 RepID=A0A2P5A1W7_9HYPO|nr:hypothetical protein TGAM01_v200976 [Trichoderma gamsii]PON30536.1 hypothetical protein TGAM01_v200976 [Trichoderma gamsii]